LKKDFTRSPFCFIEMKENEIEFGFRARYHTLGEVSDSTKAIWFVLHGYGQLARYFLKNFEILQQHNIVVIAPEGLSRFYLENFDAGKGRTNDRVGATWMTKENRLTDIRNYIAYLDSLYSHVVSRSNISVTILGFSQGAATASRWAISSGIKFEQLIIWAGVFPPDMDFAAASDKLKGKSINFVYGTKDPFLTDSSFAQFEEIRKKLDVQVEVKTFEGGHEMNGPTLLACATDRA
jgi:predicted esterase